MLPVAHAFARLARSCGTVVARKWLLGSVAAASLAGAAAPAAQAHERDYVRDYDRHGRHVEVDIRVGDRDRCEPRYEVRETRVWVPPVYRTVCDRRWVEPVYRTVCDRRWVEPVYRTECERVWVPEVCGTRECRRYDPRCGRTVTVIERVVVRPGHFETRDRRVCVSEGRFETCERRECVTEGHFENCERQELVCDGHYEVRTERVRVADREPLRDPFDVVNPVLAGLGVRVGR